MNIGYLSTVYHTSFILKSDEKDFINEIGANINWNLFSTGPAMIEAFKMGEIDLGYIGLPPVMMGISQGLKLKCVAGGHVEGTVMVANDSFSSFHDLGSVSEVLKQFEGGKIGTPAKGSIHDVIIRNLIQDMDISIINYPWADFIPSAMGDGEIIAGVGTPSLATVVSREKNGRIIIPTSKLWPYNPSYGIVVREKLIKQVPEFIKSFIKAHESASNFILQHPLEAAQLVAGELGGIDVDFVLDTYLISPKYCASLPEKYMKSTMDFIPLLRKLGYLEKNIKREDIFQLEFIQGIHPGPSHYDLYSDVPDSEK